MYFFWKKTLCAVRTVAVYTWVSWSCEVRLLSLVALSCTKRSELCSHGTTPVLTSVWPTTTVEQPCTWPWPTATVTTWHSSWHMVPIRERSMSTVSRRSTWRDRSVSPTSKRSWMLSAAVHQNWRTAADQINDLVQIAFYQGGSWRGGLPIWYPLARVISAPPLQGPHVAPIPSQHHSASWKWCKTGSSLLQNLSK